MIDCCQSSDLTLITRDKAATKIAKSVDVPVLRPEIYAANAITFDLARTRFMERLRAGMIAHSQEHPISTLAMQNIENVYAGIWEPPGFVARNRAAISTL